MSHQITTIGLIFNQAELKSINDDKLIKVYHPVKRVVFNVSLQGDKSANRAEDDYTHLFLKSSIFGAEQNICVISQNSVWSKVEYEFKAPIMLDSLYNFKLTDKDNILFAPPVNAYSLGMNIVCYSN